jgi:large subunit ribosomal protein L29
MKKLAELREYSLSELKDELIRLRKEQFNLRLRKANGLLKSTHTITIVKKTIAQIKTLMTEKAGIGS